MKNALVKLTREKIEKLENELLNNNNPNIVKGNTKHFPLKHTWFLMQGELTVATDEGTNEYIAPCYVNAPAGAKRVIHAIEDSVFINVHPNPKNITDIQQLENMLTCTSYNAYEKYKQLKQ